MLENLKLPEKEQLCPVMIDATKKLDDTDLKILIDMLNDPRWTAKALSASVTEAGFKISEAQIFKHRTKRCACAV